MKKFLTILLTGLIILSLAACGSGGNKQGNDDPLTRDDGGSQQTQGGTQQIQDGTEDPGNDDLDIDFGAIMSGNGDTGTVWGQLDAANRQAILDAARENGLEASFGADGSLTLKDPNGTEIVQKPDGTWVFKSDAGGEGQVGGNWPDNEYTKLVPKPNFTLLAAYADSNEFTVTFTDATLEQMRDYAEKVKAKGFTIDAESEEQEVMGVLFFAYAASNADGYRIEIVSSAGTSAIIITAP